jgi:hypothetical protein
MSLARVLLPCVSESFLAVDFFQKYSAKGFFSHMRWTLDGYSALVIGLLYLRWTRLFRVQCTYNTQKKKKLPRARSLNLPYTACACSFLLCHAQFYTLFWTKSHVINTVL